MPRRDAIPWGLVVLGLALAYASRSSSPSTSNLPAKRMPRAGVRWSDDDVRAFVSAVEASGVPVDYALHVYAAESGLDPMASSGISWGLPQFIGQTLRAMGWSGKAADFGLLSVREQAPYVGKLLRTQVATLGRVPTSPVDLYAVNFWPASARSGSDVILVRDSLDAKERDAYQKNQGLDRAKKGYITRGDLQTSLDRVVRLPALARVQDQIRRLAA